MLAPKKQDELMSYIKGNNTRFLEPDNKNYGPLKLAKIREYKVER